MNKTNTQEHSNPQNELEVGTQYIFNQPVEPTITNTVLEGLQSAVEASKLQAKMLVFDTLHGTHFRALRNERVRTARKIAFATEIGLLAAKDKK